MNENNENVQSQSSPTPAEQPTTCCPEKTEDKNVRNLAMLCHLLGIFGFIAPLVIWLIKKDDNEFIDSQGKAALNWQISVMIYAFVSWLLIFVFIGALLLPVVMILNLIFCIVAALKASDGKSYKYPLAINFLK